MHGVHGFLESLNRPWRNLPKVCGRRVRHLSLADEVLGFAQHLENRGEPNNSVPHLTSVLSSSAEQDLFRDSTSTQRLSEVITR
jgi:hypothetical protein